MGSALLRLTSVVASLVMLSSFGCGSILYVQVADATSGFPMSHVWIHLDKEARHYSCLTEDDGTAAFRVDQGTYYLSARLSGWRVINSQQTYKVSWGEVILARLKLARIKDAKATSDSNATLPVAAPYCL